MTTILPSGDPTEGPTGRSDMPVAGPAVALPERAAVVWRPVLVVAAVVAIVLAILSAWYGLFGDEAYFISAGHRPAAGYADQPPMLPLLAAALDWLAPGNLVVLRLPSTLITAATVVVAALMTAELGGRRWAQLVAAVAIAICPYGLATGHLLATSTVDPFCWALVLWLLARWIRGQDEGRRGHRDDLPLLGIGLVTAVALFDKILIPVLLGGLLVGVVVAGPRRVLTRPLLWLGLVVAALSTLPTWWWQAQHGWPQLAMRDVVRGEAGLFGGRWQFLPRVLYYAGIVPGAVLCVVGLWALVRLEALRPYRSLGIAVVAGTAAMLVAGGRPYYETGYYVVLFAAGAVAVQCRTTPAPVWWRWTLTPVCFVLSGALAVTMFLPVGPASWRIRWDFGAMGQVGWPELSRGVADAYATIPPQERAHAAVVTFSYWYASELEHQAATRDLPIYSPHRGFGYFGAPPDTATTVLLVGRVRWAGRFCRPLHPLPTYHSPVADGVNDRVLMALCTPSRPWSQAWPSLRYMD